ncbi:MAG: ABC transporter permease [Burkholderiaceae bacterium]|nr:ABC transporter permease [Burkholderiaceae bacterium]
MDTTLERLSARLASADRRPWLAFARRHPLLVAGACLLALMAAFSLAAPWLAPYDPTDMNALQRLKPPSARHWFGTDALGRDVFSRTLWGGRVSLVVGISVAGLATAIGVLIGMIAGFNRWADAIAMRFMDGMMAIPGILLAVALMTLTKASIGTVIVAIAVPEIPRVVRLVRALVLTIREQPYVQAAEAVGTRFHWILLRHVLPNTVTPLIVQATFICASAVIFEAYLSFLGAGTPPEIPSWGNMMAEGRSVVQLAFGIILFPGIFLGLTVLSINLLGDGLRDMLDPRIARRL